MNIHPLFHTVFLRQREPRPAVVVCMMLTLWFSFSGCAEQQSFVKPPSAMTLQAGTGHGIAGARLIIEPNDGVAPIVKLIDAAQRSVFVEAYILSQRRIIRALERAATQGVHVDVLLEPHPYGLGPQPQRAFRALSAAGVAVRWSSPKFVFTHAKFMVLDDRTAIVSTANFSQAAISRNRELLVVDRVRADIHDLSNAFRSDWDALPFRCSNRDIILSPGSRPALSRLVRRAGRSVDVYAEEIADPLLDSILIAMASRVHVRVLVAAGYTSTDIVRMTSRNVFVRRLQFPYVHAKALLVDDKLGFIGSENLSATSLDLNREVGLLVRGRVVHRAESQFEQDWARARTPHH